MTLESNKTLGGVGAILLAIPFTNIVGIILVLIAMRGMADYYNDDDIFKNTLYGFIFGIISVIALVGVILMLALGSTIATPYATPFTGFSIVVLTFVVLYVFSLVAAIFYQKALNKLAEKSGEAMFQTAGLILLIGAIIPVVGEILKLVAWILAAVGFFNIRIPNQSVAPSPAPVPPPEHPSATSEEKRYCQYCGASLQSDAAFCSKCGHKID